MQSDNSGSLGRYGRIVTFLLSCVVVFTLHCRFEISGGGISDSVLVNSLNKLYNSFTQADFADLVVLFAVWRLSEHVFSREKWIAQGTGVLALLLSVLMVTCISFKKFNSPVFILGSGFQWALSIFCICGFWMLIYLTIRSIYFLLEREDSSRDGNWRGRENRCEVRDRQVFLSEAFSDAWISGHLARLAALDPDELSRHKLSGRKSPVKTVSGRCGLGGGTSSAVNSDHGNTVLCRALSGRCELWFLSVLLFSDLRGRLDICL